MGDTMDFAAAQQDIDAILKVLNEAKQYSGLGSDDPSVIALEQIMLGKVAVLEAAKLQAVQIADAVALDPANERGAKTEAPTAFIAVEDEPNQELPPGHALN